MKKATTLLLVFLLAMSVNIPDSLSAGLGDIKGCWAGPYKEWPPLFLGVLESVKGNSIDFEYKDLESIAKSVNRHIIFLKTKVDKETEKKVFTEKESSEHIDKAMKSFVEIALNSRVTSAEFEQILNNNKELKEEFNKQFKEEITAKNLAAFIGLTLEEMVEKIPIRDLTSEELFEQFIKDLDDEDFASSVLETIRIFADQARLDVFPETNLKKVFEDIISRLAAEFGLTEPINKLQLRKAIREEQSKGYENQQEFIKNFAINNEEIFKALFGLMKKAEKKEIDQDIKAREAQEKNNIVSMFKPGGYGERAKKFDLGVGGDSLRAEEIAEGRFLFDVRDYQGHGFKGSLIKTIINEDTEIVAAKTALNNELKKSVLTEDEIKSALEGYVRTIDSRLNALLGFSFWGEIAIAFQKDNKLYYIALTQDPFLTLEEGEIKYKEKLPGSLGLAQKNKVKAFSTDFKDGALAFLYTDGILDAAWTELFPALTSDVYSKAGFFEDFDITNPKLIEKFEEASEDKINEKKAKGLQRDAEFLEENKERFEDMVFDMSFNSDKIKEFLKELWEHQKNLLSDHKKELIAKGLTEAEADAEIEKILKENFNIAGSNIQEIEEKNYDLGIFPFLIKKYPIKEELVSKVKEIYALLKLSEHNDDVSLMVIEAPRKIPEKPEFKDIIPREIFAKAFKFTPKYDWRNVEKGVSEEKLRDLSYEVNNLIIFKDSLDEPENKVTVDKIIGRIIGLIKQIQEKETDSGLIDELKEESVSDLLKRLNKELSPDSKRRVIESVKKFNKETPFEIKEKVIEAFLEVETLDELIDKLKDLDIC